MKKKRLVSLILALSIAISAISAMGLATYATDEEEVLSFSTWTPDEGDCYAILNSCSTSATGVVTVPATYEGLPVRYVSQEAFKDCTEITSLVFEGGVEVINEKAFSGCTSLTSVTFPSTILCLMDNIFLNCDNMKNIFFADAESLFNANKHMLWAPNHSWNLYIGGKYTANLVVPEGVTCIEWGAFDMCSSIKAVSLPSTIEEVETFAFYDCENLEYITIPDIPVDISERAFAETKFYNYAYNWEDGILYCGNHILSGVKATGAVTVKDGTISIASGAFAGSTVTSAVIPDSVKAINTAFGGNDTIKTVTIGSGIEVLPFRCFDDCDSLTTVNLSEGLKRIEQRAFADCISLTDINLPDSLEYFEIGSINGCNALKNLNIPSTLIDIALSEFKDNPYLKLTFDADHPRYTAEDGLVYSLDKTELMYVPVSVSGKYTIPSNVTTVGEGAFEGCINITELVIPANVITIGKNAFKDCTGIKAIVLGGGLKTIEESAFINCTGISNIAFPQNVKLIGDSAFSDCTNLQYVTLHDSIEYLGKNAFYNTKFITNLTTNTEDGNYYIDDTLVFAAGTEVVIKDGTTKIAHSAINSDEITSISLPTSLVEVGKNFNAPNLAEVHIKTLSSWLNVEYADETANILGMCPNAKIWLNGICIETTIVPSDISTIKAYKYANNRQFDFAIIPNTVTKIEDNAFYGCSSRLIFRCGENSAAHKYAEENGIKYVFFDARDPRNTVIDKEDNVIITDEELVVTPDEILLPDIGELISSIGSMKIDTIEIYGTGSTIVVIINGVRYEFTLVVKGDVNGDGVCDALDAEYLNHALHGRKDYKHHHMRAMDADSDEELTVADYQGIVNKAIA